MTNLNPETPLTLEELLQWKPPSIPEIISDGLLPKGHIMFIYGDQETWKSWLVIDLAFDIVTGQIWLVYRTQPVKVLVVNPEIPAAQYQKRINTYVKRKGINLVRRDSLRFWSALDIRIDETHGQTMLVNYVKQYQPDLIIIDGLEFVCKGDVATGFTAGAVRDTINQVRRICNSSILFVHHKKKGFHDLRTGKRVDIGIDDMYGHSIIKNMADTLIMINKDEDNEDVIYVNSVKIRMAQAKKPPPLPFKFNREKLEFELYIGGEELIN